MHLQYFQLERFVRFWLIEINFNKCFIFFKDFIPFNQRILDSSQFSFTTENNYNSGNNQLPASVTVKSQFYNGTMYGQNSPLKSQVSLVIQIK